MIIDNIFGAWIEPDERLARHRQARTGVRHNNQVAPLDPAPGQAIAVTLTTGGPQPYDAARCWWRAELADGAADEQTVELQPTDASWDPVTWGYVRRWEASIPPQPAGAMLRYRLAARVAGTDTWVYADSQATTAAGATPFAKWVADDPAPDWARDSVVYHIFVDRYNPGQGRPWLKPARMDGFFGGTLRGVIERLDDIQGMGFTAIWLSPVFASPTHHGYDSSDLYTVEPRLGTNDDLIELFAAAHARGLRVILDFVANHWSSQHPTFQAALADEASPYHSWYTWSSWPDTYQSYFGVRELPELNLSYAPARQAMIDAATHWLRAGADGLRLDYALGPSHDFWADFRRACRTANPDCWMFGEVIGDADLLRSYAGHMDGTLDFLLARAMRDTFAQRISGLAEFEALLSGHETFFPPEFIRPSFLDNHDMNRFLFMAGGDKAALKLAALLLFTLSGPPIVYYGTEVGVTQERPIHGENSFGIFEEARTQMKWGDEQDADLRAFFTRLIGLRRGLPCLVGGGRRVLRLDEAAGVYAYVREMGGESAAAVLNLSDAPQAIALPADALPADAADRLGGHPVRREGGSLVVELPARGGALLA